MSKRVILATGGTGGHLFPAESLFHDLQGKCDPIFAGFGLSTNPFFDRKNPHIEISASPSLIRLDIIAKGVEQTLRLIGRFQPHLIVGFGSYHTLPLMLGAAIKRVPLVLFMADSIPGRVVSYSSFFAKEVASVFPLEGKKSTLVEMPLRKALLQKIDPEEPFSYFGLKRGKPTLLVVGGSQGSTWINKTFSSLYSKVPHFSPYADLQAIHITGNAKDFQECRGIWESLPQESRKKIIVKSFENRMELAWSCADFALTRGGAVSLFEQYFFEVPGIAIPFPEAKDNHQEANARYFEKRGLCSVLLQRDQEAHTMAEALRALYCAYPEKKKNIQKSRSLNKNRSLAEVIEKYL